MKKKVKKVVKNRGTFWKASILDIAMTKWSVFFGTLFLVLIFPTFFLDLTEWKWAFLIISVLFAIKPLRSFFKK